MSKIFKSSYVNMGAVKEIDIPKEYFQKESDIESEISKPIENNIEEIYVQRMKEIESQVHKKLIDAKNQADAIIGDAYEDAKGIYEKAKEDGYQEGRALGYEEGKNEARGLIDESLQIKQELLLAKKTMIKEIEKDVNELVIHTIERILAIKIEEHDETILGLIQLGLEKCTYTDSLIIRVSPEDYGYVISVKDKILCLAENITDMEIRQDGALKKGGCIIDTVSGSIDSSIETQFNHIKEIFRELLESE